MTATTKEQVKITFEKDGSICMSKVAGTSNADFIEAVGEFAKRHGFTITEIENGDKKWKN